jgi:Methyltransferase domain
MNDTASEIKPQQSIELLKELHILTRDGKMNQDSRRKLKQIYHLYNFVEPLLNQLKITDAKLTLIDHGAGKSYLGFMMYDLFFKNLDRGHIYGIETRQPLIENSKKIADKLKFKNMSFLNLSVADSITDKSLPDQVDIVTALHACDTATDDAIEFAIKKNAKHIVLIPCCQAEVASVFKKNKPKQLANPMTEIWRHPIHTREFGSHVTNVFRCLQLESYGYQVTVTEFVGLEHSMKNDNCNKNRKQTPATR